jgi:hypothetical protein
MDTGKTREGVQCSYAANSEAIPKSTLSVKKPEKQTQRSFITESTSATNSDTNLYVFYLDVVIPDVTELPRIEVPIPNNYTVAQAVRRSLIGFSEDLEPKGIEVSLEPSDYIPRLSKKSGKPKMDMPCNVYCYGRPRRRPAPRRNADKKCQPPAQEGGSSQPRQENPRQARSDLNRHGAVETGKGNRGSTP